MPWWRLPPGWVWICLQATRRRLSRRYRYSGVIEGNWQLWLGELLFVIKARGGNAAVRVAAGQFQRRGRHGIQCTSLNSRGITITASVLSITGKRLFNAAGICLKLMHGL